MNRSLRKKLGKLFAGNLTLLAGPHVSVAERTAFHRKNELPDLADCHTLITGGTRKGKSGLLGVFARSSLVRRIEGNTALDPHGSFVREVRDWMANPANGQGDRVLHYLEPSSAYTFGLNPLHTTDNSWEACHDAAVTLASVIESRFEASPEETPRLARIVYVAGVLCARHDLTLLELVELLSIGGEELRRSLLQDFDNRIVRRELEDLCTLASKSPREFLNLVESTKNRFVRWLGDPRLARILGQKRGLDPLAVMDNRDVVLADLSSLTYDDAAFLGCLITSMYFAAARRRPPLQCPRHRLILDEAESLVTLNVGRMADQSAKQGLLLVAAIQRLGQLRARGDFIADALLTNCAVKICFGGLEVESARYMAETLYAGHLDLAEWKCGTERPVAVGNDKVIVHNRSRAHHHAEHTGFASIDMRSAGRMASAASATISAWGASTSQGHSDGLSLGPPEALPFDTAPALRQSTGNNLSRNTSASGAHSATRTSARHSARATGTTTSHARAQGTSLATGESEAFVTRYQVLPTAIFTLEEQLYRAAAHLAQLPRRLCVIKVEDQPPYTTRTPDLTPAFKSAAFQAEMLPRYMQLVARRSRYLVPSANVDAEIAARVQRLTTPPSKPEPDFAAPVPNQPTPADHPTFFSNGYLRRNLSARQTLRVIDGGTDGDNQGHD